MTTLHYKIEGGRISVLGDELAKSLQTGEGLKKNGWRCKTFIFQKIQNILGE